MAAVPKGDGRERRGQRARDKFCIEVPVASGRKCFAIGLPQRCWARRSG